MPRRPSKRSNSASDPVVDEATMPIERKTVTSMTRDAIRGRILRGTYRAGEPLRQDAIADQLGVSRIPVREALRLLEAEGLVTFTPHRGAVVSTLSLSEIEELFELRAEIEGDLIQRAVPYITDDQVERAESVLDVYDTALRRGQVADWGGLNWQFHSLLYAPADRPVTLGVVQRLHQHADRYARMQLALTHGESRASKEHRAIAGAVRARNPKRARSLLERHILGSGGSLLKFLRAQHDATADRPPSSNSKRT